MFNKWCTALSMQLLYENRRKYFVCSRHFAEDAILPETGRRSNLKANAIPSLFLTESMFSYKYLYTILYVFVNILDVAVAAAEQEPANVHDVSEAVPGPSRESLEIETGKYICLVFLNYNVG